MSLQDPIIEVLKPSMLGARFLDTEVPPEIKPLLELLRCRAVAFALPDEIPMWEITTADGQNYIRVQQAFVTDSEETWRELIGHLLDYAESKRKEP
jgi:hypothetical protein